MRQLVAGIVVLSLVVAAPVFAAEGEAAKSKEAKAKKSAEEVLKTPTARLSYALGMLLGESLKGLDVEISLSDFTRGVKDVLEEKETLMTRQQALEQRKELFQKQQEARAAERKEQGEKNRKEGQAFLEKNKTKSGVVATKSGLQYIVLRKGDGPKPKATDKVKVHYRGTLIDGTEFDSSYKRGQPASFPVNRVIDGWTEGLQLMSVGSKYKFFIPSELGYKERGAGREIGPNAVLIFEVELLGIE